MQNQLTNWTSFTMRALLIAGMAILVTPSTPAQDPSTPAPEVPPTPPMPPFAPPQMVRPPMLPGMVGPMQPGTGRASMPGVTRPTMPGVIRSQPTPVAAPTLDAAAAAAAAPDATPAPTGVPATALPKGSYQPPVLNMDIPGDANAKAPELKFENSPSDIVLQTYARETGRTLLFAPDAPKANISLRSQTALTRREYLQAIQTVLRMNNIALLPLGDKFLKVVPVSAALANAIENELDTAENKLHDDYGQIVSQMIQLKYITMDEASKAVTPFKRGEGQIQLFERTNSILITDRAENVNRILEIIRFLDQPHAVLEQVFSVEIHFAKAATIKQRLDEIVAESQKNTAGKPTPQANASGAPGMRSVAPPPLPSVVPGVVRAPLPSQPSVYNQPNEMLMDDAARGVIRGKVMIMADERTNILIIFTQKQNMDFFRDIISVLDVSIAPDVDVEVKRLEYADAEDVAKILNDLIGNVKAEQPKTATGTPASGATSEYKAGEPATLAGFAERLRAAATPAATPATTAAEAAKGKVGELNKDNIKILSNKRINAVIIMAGRSDTETLLKIIHNMDIPLSQVLIETVVLDVTLTSGLTTGVDWVQRMRQTSKFGGIPYAGGGGGGNNTPVNLLQGAVSNLTTAGIQYFFTLPDLNVDAVIKASSTDGRAKILTSPVLLTQDNKDATIEATQLRYLFKGYTTIGTYANGAAQTQANVDQRNVGLTVKITPRINPTGMVALKVDETYEDIGPDQSVDGQNWPTIQTRKLSADVAVKSGETIILGGLVRNEKTSSSSKIPLLGDIPFIGPYLFGSTSSSDARSELLIFLTPYVLDTPESGAAEARRRKDYLDVKGMWTKGWSNSKLADETIVQKIKREKAEHATERAKEREENDRQYESPTAVRELGVMSSTVTTNVVIPAANAPSSR